LGNVVKRVKVKVTPLPPYAGTDGRRRNSSNAFATLALERGGWLAPHPGRFTRRKDLLPIVQEVGWASLGRIL
jgi:hypothetical protein